MSYPTMTPETEKFAENLKFDIEGFYFGKKFENSEEDASEVDAPSECQGLWEACLFFERVNSEE